MLIKNITRKKTNRKIKLKKLIKLRENVHNNKKILKFKKKKWQGFIRYSSKKHKWYRKYQLINQNVYLASGEANYFTQYKKKHKITLQVYTWFKIFYAIKKKSIVKKHMLKFKNKRNSIQNMLFYFEKRLDTILYRAKFCFSIKQAQQLILQKKVLVNGETITYKNYLLKPGDTISINKKFYEMIIYNVVNINFWPMPPKYLMINYKNLEIVLLDLNTDCFSSLFSFHLNSEKLILDLPRQ